MGTSRSHPGTPSTAPLVPPWADPEPDVPLPIPPSRRFAAFRTSLGKLVRTGDVEAGRQALGHFARTSTGGAAHGHRRYGAISRAGGAFITALGNSSAFRESLAERGVDLTALEGASAETIIAVISQAFATGDGDRERVELAIAVALSEAYEGLDITQFPELPDDRVNLALTAYVRECVYSQILMESGKALDSGGDGDGAAAERTMHQLVASVVEVEMAAILDKPARGMSRAEIEAIQLRVVREVWTRWEGQ